MQLPFLLADVFWHSIRLYICFNLKTKQMKTIITVLSITLGTSLFAQKTTVVNTSETPVSSISTSQEFPEMGTAITGEVVNVKDCPIHILASINNEIVKIHPTNLPMDFQVHGMRINFDYKVAPKVSMPAECNFKAAVEVSAVKQLKVTKQ